MTDGGRPRTGTQATTAHVLLGAGQRDGGWDGSGLSNARLAILLGLTHYTTGLDPALAAMVIPFLDEPETAGP